MQEDLDPEIVTDYGANLILAAEFNVSPATITRYLKGHYRKRNETRLALINAIRERARQMVGGIKFYVGCDDDGSLHYFTYEPRKEFGQWLNKLDPYNRPTFPADLLPESARPKPTDVYPISLTIIRNPNRQ